MTLRRPTPPSRERIERFERYYRVRFPSAYVDFLCDGVELKGHCFDSTQGEELVERFLPLLDDPNEEVEGPYDLAVVTTQLGARLASGHEEITFVPIAALFAGDFVVLDFSAGRANPAVAIWNHELSKDFAPSASRVCNSFEEFLALLHPCSNN